MKIFNKKKFTKKISFSIITPVLNDCRIEKNINSLKRQTYKNFEHIIIDGGSKEEVIKILKKNKTKIHTIISEKDRGIYDAINKGIKASKGDIIGILNADDFYYNKSLSIVKKYFDKYPIDFFFGSVMKDRLHHNYWPNKIWWKFNIFPSHSCGFFIKRNIHNKLGFYNTKFKYSSDRDFIFKLIRRKFKGMCGRKYEILGKFDPGGISSRIGFFNNIKEEFMIRINNNQSIFFLIPLFVATTLLKLFYSIFKLNIK
jgi:glycosyltransferase involved in cell wall biosynthesis